MSKDEWLRKWVEALRGGGYRQGKSFMAVNGCYCPLGVACAIYNKHSEIPTSTDNVNYDGVGVVKAFDGYMSFPPPAVSDAFDMRPDFIHAIASMNDNGMSFRDMADLIEDSIYN